MASPDSFGGYEENRFENTVDIKLQCSVCLKVFKDPVQCPNEHYTSVDRVFKEICATTLKPILCVNNL